MVFYLCQNSQVVLLITTAIRSRPPWTYWHCTAPTTLRHEDEKSRVALESGIQQCSHYCSAAEISMVHKELYYYRTRWNQSLTEGPLLEVTLADRWFLDEALALLAFMSVWRRRSLTLPRRAGVAKTPAFFLRFSSILRSSRTCNYIIILFLYLIRDDILIGK